MNDVELLLLGFVLGAAPASEAGRLAVAAIAKALGVSPRDVTRYERATDGDPTTDPNE
jgi:hypothetical protein